MPQSDLRKKKKHMEQAKTAQKGRNLLTAQVPALEDYLLNYHKVLSGLEQNCSLPQQVVLQLFDI